MMNKENKLRTEIICRLVTEGKTFDEIGEAFGITRQFAFAIYKREKSRMVKRIQNDKEEIIQPIIK